jgi:hypothetical protein
MEGAIPPPKMLKKRKIATPQEVARDVRKGEMETPVEIRHTTEKSPYGKSPKTKRYRAG